MSTITLCSSHVWLGLHKPQGKKKLLLQVTHFPVAFCCCKIVPCSTPTLHPPLPILNHYRLCPVGVYFQYMTAVQLRSALKLLQPAHSSAFRCFAFLKSSILRLSELLSSLCIIFPAVFPQHFSARGFQTTV